jgi:hypothetical protein
MLERTTAADPEQRTLRLDTIPGSLDNLNKPRHRLLFIGRFRPDYIARTGKGHKKSLPAKTDNAPGKTDTLDTPLKNHLSPFSTSARAIIVLLPKEYKKG